MRRHMRKIFAATLLILASVFPPTLTEAQRRGPRQRRAGQAQAVGANQNSAELSSAAQMRGRRGSRGQKSQGGSQKVTIVRQVSQATAPASIMGRLRSEALPRAMVTVRGRTVRPRPGNSMYQLSDGGILVLGTDQPDEAPHAVEGDIFYDPKKMKWIFKGCLCPGKDGDDCRIRSAATRTCYSTNPNENCCSWTEIEIGGSDLATDVGPRR